jgi:GNAT superfamily N-acetyltransferase
MVALDDEKVLATGQVYPIPYLSKFWGISIGGLGHLVVNDPTSEQTHGAAVALTSALIDSARGEGMAFLSASVPGPSIALARALEKNCFVYAEGFINMVGPTNNFREEFRVPGLKIRNPIEKDFESIADSYAKVNFPSRFVTDGGFDPNRAQDLYVRRYREVFEEKIGKIFIAELENEFAGALIAIIDEKMAKTIGIKTNVLSGMGIIIHPRAVRKGVSMALIEHRQDYYKSKGVKHVNFGANFNNGPMILGLSKLGLKYGSLDMTFHFWLK